MTPALSKERRDTSVTRKERDTSVNQRRDTSVTSRERDTSVTQGDVTLAVLGQTQTWHQRY